MDKSNFWKKEFRLTPRSLLWLLPTAFVLTCIFSWIFINYVFPSLAALPGFRGLLPRFPVVVEKTEQVFINQNVNVQGVFDKLRPVTATVIAAPRGSEASEAVLRSAKFGAGLVVTSDGYIFTVKSTLGSADSAVWVLLDRGEVYPAQIVAFDPRSELALVKIAVENLPVASFGDADALTKGDSLVTLGASLGKSQAASAVVSAVKLPAVSTLPPVAVSSDVLSSFLSVSPELAGQKIFEGAPLAARDAAVVGLVSAAGVIPGQYLEDSLKFFLNKDSLLRPVLGLRYLPVTPGVAAYLKLSREYGALLSSEALAPAVRPGSPGQRAGLRDGDFIYKINGREMTEKDTLEKILANPDLGQALEVNFLRGGAEQKTTINLK
jgi:S1-C subfamily serine protease